MWVTLRSDYLVPLCPKMSVLQFLVRNSTKNLLNVHAKVKYIYADRKWHGSIKQTRDALVHCCTGYQVSYSKHQDGLK